MTSGIYLIRQISTGKQYIGSSCKVESRFKKHKSFLALGKHENRHLQNAWIKYGEHDFEFLVLECCSVDALLPTEQKYLDQLDWGVDFNIERIAGSPMLGLRHSQEARVKMSERHRGRKFSEQHKENLSASRKLQPPRRFLETACKNMARVGESNGRFGKPVSEETKRKISEAKRLKKLESQE